MPQKKKPRKLKLVKKTKKSKLKVVKKAKKNRRNQTQFPALEKKYNLVSRQEMLDFDYLNKLNDKEKAWLNKFVEEEVNASFRHSAPLNKTKKQRKACYDSNNRRNRDYYLKNKIRGFKVEFEDVRQESVLNPERLLIGIEEREDYKKQGSVFVEQQNNTIKELQKQLADLNQKREEILKTIRESGKKIKETTELLKELNDLDNSLDSAEKSKDSTQKKH